MSDSLTIPVTFDEDQAASPEPDVFAPAGSSILGQLHKDLEDRSRQDTIVLPVGRSTVLACRYRALSDKESATIVQRIEKAQKLTRSNTTEVDEALQIAAATLGLACVELVWTGSGNSTPLVDALRADGQDTQGDEALRYDRRLASILGLQVPEPFSAAGVVLALHRWENGGSVNHMPLAHAIEQYNRFVAGELDDTLDEVVEGN